MESAKCGASYTRSSIPVPSMDQAFLRLVRLTGQVRALQVEIATNDATCVGPRGAVDRTAAAKALPSLLTALDRLEARLTPPD